MKRSLEERRELRQKLARDERFHQLVELAPDGIFIHDGMQILLANRAALRLAGAHSRTEVIGQSINKFLDPPYLKCIERRITTADDLTPFTPLVRDTFHRIDGIDVPVEVRAVAYIDQDHPSVHLIVRDLREHIASEALLQETTERAEHAHMMDAVGVLSGGMAHEVNNLMSVVLGCSELLRTDDRLPAQCLEDVTEIMRAAERAADIAHQMLAFSRRAIQFPRRVSLDAVVARALLVVQPMVGDSRALIGSGGSKESAWVDETQFEQVIINLLLNARDATRVGGTIVVVTGDVHLEQEGAAANGGVIPPGHYCTVSVRDDGEGIPVGQAHRIFEPFFTTKPVGAGAGLGLAAAHGIVTQSEGFIAFTSTPGEGATFTVYVPLHVESATVLKTGLVLTPPLSSGSPSKTVLVVDDEAGVRSVTARILRHSGYQVIEANDGADALRMMASATQPHLVLTDVSMPQVGGIELTQLLRKRWPGLPVIFMSGFASSELQQLESVVTNTTVLQKPFAIPALLDAIRIAIERTVLSAIK